MSKRSSKVVSDVRMRGFARRHTVEAALAWLDGQLQTLGAESISLRSAAGRVLAEHVVSPVDVPGFDRATMDGYAVVAGSTEGATSYNPLTLTVVGDALPGKPFSGGISSAQTVRIMTGAPMPEGCDAVLPAEWAEDDAGAGTPAISVLASVPPGKHVGRRGEDVPRGTVLFQPGRVLRPQDLGVLSSIGLGALTVCRRPTV